jgi:hypothetical protein
MDSGRMDCVRMDCEEEQLRWTGDVLGGRTVRTVSQNGLRVWTVWMVYEDGQMDREDGLL